LPAVSFVIPVLDESDRIAPLLRDLRARYPGAELLVVDGGSHDATVELAAPLCDHLLHCAPGRAGQMNTGAQTAGGDYLLFLHADSMPTIHACALARALGTRPTWGFCPVRLSGDERVFRVISRFMNWRSRLTAVATGDQMLFVDRATFLESGGFDDVPLMEDVALCKRLRRRARPSILPSPVVSSSRRWRQRGVVRTVLHMWALRLAYSCGVSTRRLHRSYYGGGRDA
jgi:rSAM/selenodomain-associated transferase 2